MSAESATVSEAEAQAVFERLPSEQQWPTLSPTYVGADASRDPSLTPRFLISRQAGGWLLHSVHESSIARRQARDWQSAYGYGGPIAHNLGQNALARAWEDIDDEAARRNVVAEFIRFHPLAGNQSVYPGTVRADRPVVSIDLDVDDLVGSYTGRARTSIRKAQHEGLLARWETSDSALGQFPGFYRQCMREIAAANFYLFPDLYFERILTLGMARVLSIVEGESILCMGLFLFGPAQAEYHLSGTTSAGRSRGATNLLLHTAAMSARAAGCRQLYLGGGTSARPDDPLLRFKASFAKAGPTFHIGHRIFDPTMYQRLRDEQPERAASGRILFYRS